ncbi:hypothetical protein ACH5RR_012636 [Cinchona calisaya]|uniref:RNase H type-1 domain-containing protein n=1 Tax=Cinchona calisaya TaxID=153742 RepID=A0ABD3ABQ4_9GENT
MISKILSMLIGIAKRVVYFGLIAVWLKTALLYSFMSGSKLIVKTILLLLLLNYVGVFFAGVYGWIGIKQSLSLIIDPLIFFNSLSIWLLIFFSFFFFFVIRLAYSKHMRHAEKLIGWEPPPTEFWKLNTDDSSWGNPSIAGGGGVIRNSLGEWIVGFSRQLGVASNNLAEVWALRDGLKLTLDSHCTRLFVETDSHNIIHLLNSKNSANHTFSHVIDDCRVLLRQFHQVKVQHAFCEANVVADCLAKEGAKQHEIFVIHYVPLSYASTSLLDDSRRVSFPRMIVMNG